MSCGPVAPPISRVVLLAVLFCPLRPHPTPTRTVHHRRRRRCRRSHAVLAPFHTAEEARRTQTARAPRHRRCRARQLPHPAPTRGGAHKVRAPRCGPRTLTKDHHGCRRPSPATPPTTARVPITTPAAPRRKRAVPPARARLPPDANSPGAARGRGWPLSMYVFVLPSTRRRSLPRAHTAPGATAATLPLTYSTSSILTVLNPADPPPSSRRAIPRRADATAPLRPPQPTPVATDVCSAPPNHVTALDDAPLCVYL